MKRFPACVVVFSAVLLLHSDGLAATMLDEGLARATGAIRPTPQQLASFLRGATEIAPRRVALAGQLPRVIDNSTKPWFPPVGDQGGLGSCVQWAEVYYSSTYAWCMENAVPAVRFQMSPKWTYNWLNQGSTGGTYSGTGYEMAKDHGLLTMAEMPYDEAYLELPNKRWQWQRAAMRRLSGYSTIRDVDSINFDTFRQALADGRVFTASTFILSWQIARVNDDSSIAADDEFVGELIGTHVAGKSGGHQITIVGYNDDIWVDIDKDGVVDANEKGAFKIANSWGPDWGNKGYVWLAYHAVKTPNPAYPTECAFWSDVAASPDARILLRPQAFWNFDLASQCGIRTTVLIGIGLYESAKPSFLRQPKAFNGCVGLRPISGSFSLPLDDYLEGKIKRHFLTVRAGTGDYSVVVSNVALSGRKTRIWFASPDSPVTSEVQFATNVDEKKLSVERD